MRTRAHESRGRIRKAPLPLIAIVAAFVWVIFPFESNAEITVEPPTGSADPAMKDELRVAIDSMIAGAALAHGYEVDGRLRVSVDATGEGQVSIKLELAPSDGSAPIRDSRIASRGNASADARGLARQVIRAAARRAEGIAAQSAAAPKSESSAIPIVLRLDAPYNPRLASWLSGAPTLAGVLLGGLFLIPFVHSAQLDETNEGEAEHLVLVGIVGEAIASFVFVSGPALGHFYAGNRRYAWLSYAGKFMFGGGAAGAFSGAALNTHDEAIFGGCVALGSVLAAATLALVIADLATLPRAVRRANEKASEQEIYAVAVAPLIAPGPNGSTTAGLAFSMRF